MKLRVLISDLGNVILPFDRALFFRRMAEHSGINEDQIRAAFESAGIGQAYERGELDDDGVYEKCCGLLPGDPPGRDEFFDAWNDIFWSNIAYIRFLEALRNRLTLVLLSNTNRSHFEFIRKRFPRAVAPFGDRLVLSYEMRTLKPDPVMFERAMELADVEPGECLYVDDIDEYVSAAREFGMTGIVYENHKQFSEMVAAHGLSLGEVKDG